MNVILSFNLPILFKTESKHFLKVLKFILWGLSKINNIKY